MSGPVTAPQRLTSEHDVSAFECTVPELNDWLKRRALQNEGTRASRTFVVIGDERVVGYYALATGAVAHAVVTGKVRRNMPEPIPVMVVVRLAVDRVHQGSGLGHAISEEAKRFYVHHGLAESPVDPMTMMITLADVEKAIGISRERDR